MKLVLFSTVLFLFVSCSDNLNTSKAKKLISECDAKYPKYEVSLISTGNNLSLNEEKIKIYNQLKNDKLLNIDKRNNSFGQTIYNITLTEKGEKYINNDKKNNFRMLGNSTPVTSYKLKLKSVNSIHEIPSINAAEISVTYEKEATPFAILNTGLPKEKSMKVTILKTNKGWIACD